MQSGMTQTNGSPEFPGRFTPFLFRLAVEVAGPVATGAGAAGTLQLKLKRGIDVKITDVRKRYISTKVLQLFDLPLSYDWYKYG